MRVLMTGGAVRMAMDEQGGGVLFKQGISRCGIGVGELNHSALLLALLALLTQRIRNTATPCLRQLHEKGLHPGLMNRPAIALISMIINAELITVEHHSARLAGEQLGLLQAPHTATLRHVLAEQEVTVARRKETLNPLRELGHGLNDLGMVRHAHIITKPVLEYIAE
jgi:hypothetical protein